MKKTKTKIMCPFCTSLNNSEKEVLMSEINNTKYTLHICSDCELQFFTPLKFENIYENEKDGEYISYHQGRTELASWTLKIGNSIRKLKINLKNKDILDVGAGDCINYKMLSEQFHINPDQYYAVELDKRSLASGKKRGVKHIIPKYFDKQILKIKKKFDIVIASEVLEHQVNPKEFLETCTGMLKEKGIIIITVPNRERLFLAQRAYPEDCPPHHFLRFNKTFFRANFKKRVMFIDHYGYGFNDMKGSCAVISKKILKSKTFWIIFWPVVLILRLLDQIKGIGIIVVLKK